MNEQFADSTGNAVPKHFQAQHVIPLKNATTCEVLYLSQLLQNSLETYSSS